jgi:FkbM family methyltransferase
MTRSLQNHRDRKRKAAGRGVPGREDAQSTLVQSKTRPLISYAQNFEDVMLNRVFRGRENGFYVDVGAADPTTLSVTKWFYDLGWSGINIEPHPEFYQRLVEARPRDINLNCGAGARSSQMTFFELPVKEWSSFDPAVQARASIRGERTTKRTIPIVPLNEILKRHLETRTIDFLKIDVEGWERDVLRGIDLQRHRPTVILVEATSQGTPESNHLLWEDILTAAQFKPVYFDGLNKFYVPQEHEHLAKHFAVPPNPFDEFILADTMTLKEREQHIEELGTLLKRSEASHASATEQINSLAKLLKESEADRAARGEQIGTLTIALKEVEADRAARGEQISTLTTALKESDADRAARGKQIGILTTALKESDADRAARGEQIGILTAVLKETEADRSARGTQIKILTADLLSSEADLLARFEQIATLSRTLEESDADRAARLKHINTLTKLLHEREADHRGQIDFLTKALHDSDADRAARLDQIHILTSALQQSERDRKAHAEQIEVLTCALQTSETARTAHSAQIEDLTLLAEDLRTERSTLSQQIETLERTITVLESDLASQKEFVRQLEAHPMLRAANSVSRLWRRRPQRTDRA